MELRQLRYLVILADEGQFGRAAHRLHVTQQALSMAMTALERSAGCTLLVRGRGRRVVEPTAAGARLVRSARDIVAQADRAAARLRPDGPAPDRDRFVVGLLGGGLAELTTPILRRFRARHPDLPLTVQSVDHGRQQAALQAGDVDVLLGPAESAPPGTVLTHLFSDPLVVALPLGHRLQQTTRIRPADLAPERRVTFESTAAPAPLRPAGCDAPQDPVPQANLESVLAAVGAAVGVALLPASTARFHPRPDIAYRSLADSPVAGFAVLTGEPDAADPTGPVADFVRVATDTVRSGRTGPDGARPPLRRAG